MDMTVFTVRETVHYICDTTYKNNRDLIWSFIERAHQLGLPEVGDIAEEWITAHPLRYATAEELQALEWVDADGTLVGGSDTDWND
jgi:hypothetical protein